MGFNIEKFGVILEQIGSEQANNGLAIIKASGGISARDDIQQFISENKSTNQNTIIKESFIAYDPQEMMKKFRNSDKIKENDVYNLKSINQQKKESNLEIHVINDNYI